MWAPAGDFFGTGYKLSPYRSWYTAVTGGGLMESAWVMPFKESCELTLRNVGTIAVEVSQGALVTSPWKWDSRSMHFGAGWTELNRVSTRTKANDHYDVNYVTLQGEGVLVGTGVTLFNTAQTWWGEGDEKIFVDEAVFPTHIGTGSEDYYSYAWGNGNFFDHPFIAQPCGTGAASFVLNGAVLIKGFDAYSEKLGTRLLELGAVDLKPDMNELTLTITGENPKAVKDQFLCTDTGYGTAAVEGGVPSVKGAVGSIEVRGK